MDNFAQIIAQLLGTVPSPTSGAKARHQAVDKADDTPPMGHEVPHPFVIHLTRHSHCALLTCTHSTQHIAYGVWRMAYGVLHTPFLLGIR